MRVLALNSRLSDRGGADRWLLGVLARLQDRADTHLLVGTIDSRLDLSEHARIGPVTRLKGLDGRGLRKRGIRGSLRRLSEALRDLRPHAILVNDITHPEVLGLISRTGIGAMMVQDHRFFCPGRGKLDIDGALCRQAIGEPCLRCFDDPSYGRAILELTERRLATVRQMARLLVLSPYMRDELALVGVDPDRVSVIPPFVDGLDTHPPLRRTRRYHLLAGRLAEHKGVRVALGAVARLRARVPLLVAGEGPLAEEVAAAGRGVDWIGWADRARMTELFDGAVSLWLPSLWAEPFGIVGLEAAARRVPVIGSRCGGIEDWLVDGRNGLLVRPGSGVELAAAADRLAQDPSLALSLGRYGQARVRAEHDPARIIDRLVAAFQGLGPGDPARPFNDAEIGVL